MNEKGSGLGRFSWLLPVCTAAGASLIFLSLSLYTPQWGVFLYLLGVVPVTSLVLLIAAMMFASRREQSRALIAVTTMFVFWAVSGILWRNQVTMRTEIRWLFESKTYKAQVLSQPLTQNGELKHIEWDGWGFPGAGDTVVYLVFDPTDSLAAAARSHLTGKFNGIPCAIPDVRRLEKDWYTTLFYTDTDWNHCA